MLRKELLPYLADDKTRDLAEKQILAFKTWHRRTMLRKYGAFLRKVAASSLSQEEVAQHFQEGTRLWEETIVGGMRFMAVVLVDHTSKKQLAHTRRAMAKAYVERLKKASRPFKERISGNTKKTVEGFERFTGDLNGKQKRIIAANLQVMSASTLYWLKGQQARQAALLIFLAQRPKRGELETFLRRLVLKPEQFSDSVFLKRLTEIRTRIRKMLFDVLSAMDSKQRQHFKRTLLAYAADLDALAR
jgi:hypothetical protein